MSASKKPEKGTLVIGHLVVKVDIYSKHRDKLLGEDSMVTGLVKMYEGDEVGRLVVQQLNRQGKKFWSFFLPYSTPAVPA